MGNKSGKPESSPLPPPNLKPMEETLTEIIARPIKENDIRFKDLDRFSHRICIFDTDQHNKQPIQLIDKGLKLTANNNDDNKEEKKVEMDPVEEKWDRLKTIIACVSELFTKYNNNEKNVAYHHKLCGILQSSGNLANKTGELCAIIMNDGANFGEYRALNILSALCQSNAQVAFTYITFKYFNRYGYDGVSDVPSDDGWQIHIYFNWNNSGDIRILNKKQGRRATTIKNQRETEFIINWEMDNVYNKDANQCVSVMLQSTGFAFVNDKLRKKQQEKIKTDLLNGEYVVYTYNQ